MRIAGIFALGGSCDYGCYDPYKSHKDYYPYGGYYGGYPGYYNGYDTGLRGYRSGYSGKHYYVPPACLYGSRF